jgi:A/G-specific adenine glycosylase
MLQQTRVDTIVGRFPRFLNRFPSLEALAESDLDEVRSEWAGLGYYRRCENLWKGARFVLENYEGQLPKDPAELKKIPGVGDYTASAIAAIAFDVPTGAIDGNVLRVGGRFMADPRSIADTQFKKTVRTWADSVVAEGSPPVLVQALMEIGATVCMPTIAHCDRCPLEIQCAGSLLPDPTEVPAAAPRAKPARWTGMVAVGVYPDGKLVFERRPEKGLLGGLWFLPGVVGPKDDPEVRSAHKNARQNAAALFGVETDRCGHSTQASWRFSHILLEPTIVTVHLDEYCPEAPRASKSKDRWAKEAVPSVTRHFLKSIGQELDGVPE